ncbi:LysE family transporter [Streptosporangiaceae bacterium NEAU-GS5]|nr:LysE family transporter [Streptosporangiaceae bacterium NEAU-GS5]
MRELLLGLGLGLGAGVAPGALLGLVITASLRDGFPAGARLACVPLFSDLPVVLLTVTAVGALPDVLLRVLSVAGGLYVAYLGVTGVLQARTARPPASDARPPSSAWELAKGVLVNLLNPHPWLFWTAVGAPIVLAAHGAAKAWFVAGFYAVLVASKIALAALIGAGRHRLGSRGYRLLLGTSALLMIVAGAALVVEATVSGLG